MPTEKRDRKREAARARLEAERRARQRAERRKRLILAGLAAALLVGVLALSTLRNDDGSDQQVLAEGSTTTTSTATTSTTTTGTGSSTTAAPAAGGEPAPCPPAGGSAERRTEFPAPPPTCIDPAKTYTARVETDVGAFTIALDPKTAPQTVNNFVYLSRYKFYDGVVFHRVVPEFVVQGGDPEGTGRGGPGYDIPDEFPASGPYPLGSVAMANTGQPNSGGSQFFVVSGPNGGQLPPKYTRFGQVKEGLETIERIEADGAPDPSPPRVEHSMTKVTITEA